MTDTGSEVSDVVCVCVFVYPVSALYGTTQTQTEPIRAEVTVLQALYWPTVERHVGSSSDNGVCVCVETGTGSGFSFF